MWREHINIVSENIRGLGVRAAKGRLAMRVAVSALALAIAALMALRGDVAILSFAAQWDARAPVSRVRRDDGRIALTFDSGWGEDLTELVLSELEARQLRATFFLTGYWIDENPDSARLIVEAGHELGGHSVTHSRMVGMDDGALDAEITGVSARIWELAGGMPRYFRPPYGDWDLRLLRRVRQQGQIAVTWSVDAQSLSPANLSAALDSARSGDIVLMGLSDAALGEVLGAALDDMLARGLKPGTVSELMGRGAHLV